jgi:catechol 2,3-dioxygenase-like lactoylglutathione lyase family enzyme
MRSALSLGPLHQVALPCADLARGVAFYRDLLGLRLIAQFDPPGLAFFALGDARLLLDRSDAAKPGGGALYFRVADIAAAQAELAARGVAFDQPPHLIFPDDAGTFGPAGEGEWMAFFRDPDGNTLALASRQR